ncbi:MAG: GNAT family N-acetyltransferase [Oscillospiraceae bacterium]|nr:GNAT family N-acetyltransferase [Oscillospiraceae bacterium]
MNYNIREIQARDNKIVEEIIRSCLLEFGGKREGTAWWDPDLGRFSEIYNTEEKKYWVAETAELEIVGGVGIAPLAGAENDRICELQKMYCIPKVRGTGVSHKLIGTALEHARKYYDKCYLETFGNMNAAQKFYEKYGFERIDKPLGNTGHYGCDVMYIKQLTEDSK